MATKKLSFIDQVILELERIATDAGLPFFVDDRHNSRYEGEPIQIGNVAAGHSLRQTVAAANYEIQGAVAYFTLRSVPGANRYPLKPGDDDTMTAFLDDWEDAVGGKWQGDEDLDGMEGDDGL